MSGWTAPDVLVPGVAGVIFFALFLLREATTAYPMLPLALFKRRNFAAGNIETFAMYAGLSVLFFYLVLFLQQVAGYSALEAGAATLPTTAVMFVLSKRAGALADRYGPRPFMGGGPLVAAAGLLLMLRVDADADYLTELLPALLVFSLGLSATVAPLTATVLADADEENAGIASGVNNAIARAAGLLGVAAIGAVIAAQFASQLNDRIDPSTLSPASMAVVRVAEDARAGGRRRVRPAARGGRAGRRRGRGGVGQRLPHRHGDQRRARRPRRDPRDRARPHAPPPRLRRGLRGRPARRGAARSGARARAGRRAGVSLRSS